MNRIKNLICEFKCLIKNIPGILIGIFFVSIICMNILANKTVFENSFIAIDGGIFVSWVVFIVMDIITIRFGPKASILISISGVLCNILVALLFKLVSVIPTQSDFSSFNTIVGGTWFITISSIVAQFISSIVNNFTNYTIGKIFSMKESKVEYICRSYISTFLGQFVDNLVFSSLAFIVFAPLFWEGFHWTISQAVFCSLLGAIVELVSQIIFSPIGYNVIKKWEKDNVGSEYRTKYLN